MNIFSLKNLLAGSVLVLGSLSAFAEEYISAPISVNPPDGTMGEMFGMIIINWDGVRLEMENHEKDTSVKNYIDPSFVSITLNGEEKSIDNTLMGGSIFVKYVEEENAAGSNGNNKGKDLLYIEFPSSFPNGYPFWKGIVDVDIKDGAVISTTGEINPPIRLVYYFMNVNGNIIWSPENNSSFVNGYCTIKASWENAESLSFNENVSTFPFLQKEDPSNNDKYGDHIPVTDYLTIENNSIIFDFNSFTPGNYCLTIPEATILMDEEFINKEETYNFTIMESKEAPSHYVKVLPSEVDWFDGFSIRWGEKQNQPYQLSSKYAEFNDNLGKYVFNSEGISLINVKENGTEDVEILAVALEEYQEEENKPHYRSAQLVITLEDIQTNIDSHYSLLIPAGLISIETPEGVVTNEEVTYSFTLKSGEAFELPSPEIIPDEGNIESLDEVKIIWEGVLGGYDLLNLNKEVGDKINITKDGEIFEAFNSTLIWSSIDAQTPGAEGDILVISFNEPQIEEGTYIINIPANYIFVTDIEKGTLPNEEIIITYLISDSSAINSVNSSQENCLIFNVQGVAVGRKNEIKDLKKVPKGIYIINGKKYINK